MAQTPLKSLLTLLLTLGSGNAFAELPEAHFTLTCEPQPGSETEVQTFTFDLNFSRAYEWSANRWIDATSFKDESITLSPVKEGTDLIFRRINRLTGILELSPTQFGVEKKTTRRLDCKVVDYKKPPERKF